MIKLMWALMAIALAVPGVARAQFVDGNTLKGLGDAFERVEQSRMKGTDDVDSARYLGYMQGVVDALVGYGDLCLPKGTKARQAAAIVRKFLNDHPEQLGQPGGVIISAALKPVWPCVGKKP
jgi:hypothetical protein